MDRIDAMRAFVQVAIEGSFTQAADRLDSSPQLVSKYVSQLEEHLGVRLLNRTTRKVHLTEAGSQYVQRAQQVLADIEEMEAQLGDLQQAAKGLLRISAPVSFATRHLPRLLNEFQIACPEVAIDLQLNDRKIDIVEEGFDIALRIGSLKSSSLIAKKVAPVRLVTCASPDYLKQYGTPKTPEDLQQHRYLKYSYLESNDAPFVSLGTQDSPLLQRAGFSCNNGDVLSQVAIAGGGIVLQPTFIAGDAINTGQLQTILQEYEPEPLGLYAVYAHRKFVASKVRSFVDFIDGYFGDPPYWDGFAG